MDASDFVPSDEVVAGIRRDIEAYEQRRAAAHAAVTWRVPVFLGALVVGALIVAWFFNAFADPYERWFSTPHVFLYFFTLVAAFFLYPVAVRPATDLQQGFRTGLLPTVFGFVDGLRYRHEETPPTFDRLPREAVGAFNRQTFDDCLSGTYAGFAFELYEAVLAQKTGKSSSTAFRGVVVAFELERPFPGLLIATRKSGQVISFFRGLFGGSRLQQLESGLPAIDDIYDFRTDNPDAALPLVRGRMAQALQWLAEAWPDEPARIALRGIDGFLLLPTSKNFFELPPISVPLDYQTHVAPLIADLAMLLATAALVRKVGGQEA
jgi:hypothetical protein